jgi:hypothetical protein
MLFDLLGVKPRASFKTKEEVLVIA